MKFLTLLILLFSTQAFAQSIDLGGGHQLQYKGHIGYGLQYFPLDASNKQQVDQIQTLESGLELTLQTPWNLDLRLKPKLYFDLAHPETSWNLQDGKLISENRSILYFEDLYLDWYNDYLEVRAGFQTYSWKTVESLAWGDILNQTDGQLDFFNAPKYGELSLRTRFILPTEEEQFLEVYYLPYFSPTRYPQEDSRYDFFADQPSKLNNNSNTYGSSQKQWRPQYALRYTRPFLEDIDLALFFFHGYDRSPILQPRIFAQDQDGNVGPSEFGSHYEIAYMGGLSFQGSIDSWLLKGELLGHRFEKESIQTPAGSVKPDPYLAYTLGFEYTFYSPIIENHDLGTLFEAIGTSNSGQGQTETLKFIPFQNHIFTGLRYTFNNSSDRAILLGVFNSWKKYETVGKFEYEERLFNRLKLKLGGFLLVGQSNSSISQFEKASRIDGSVTWNF